MLANGLSCQFVLSSGPFAIEQGDDPTHGDEGDDAKYSDGDDESCLVDNEFVVSFELDAET